MRCSMSRLGAVLLAASVALQVKIAQSQSSASFVTARTPGSLTQSHATTITITVNHGGNAIGNALLNIQQTSCSVDPTVNIGNTNNPYWAIVGSFAGTSNDYTYSVTLGTVATDYKICYKDKDGNLRAAQTGVSDIEVVAPTTSTRITGFFPTTIVPGTPYAITFTGTVNSGDKVLFTTGACSAADAAMTSASALSATGVNPTNAFTVSPAGSYKLCYRDNKGSDEVQQGSLSLAVQAAAGSDPVALYGDKIRVFELPPRVLLPLMEAADMRLSGETFSYGGDWQQWFGRLVLFTPDESRWMEIRIKKNILEFNRSKIPQYAQGNFETLKVTLGHGPVDNPSVTADVPSPDVKIPLNFLGFHVLFWKMAKKTKAANTMIGTAHRECMEVAGANSHFYVCSTAAHEFWGFQRDLSIVNAHLDLSVLEFAGAAKGLLTELWGMHPLSEITKSYITYDSGEDPKGKKQNSTKFLVSPDPKSILRKGQAWAGGGGEADLFKACIVDNRSQTLFGCEAPLRAKDTASITALSV